jgi:hypothetical protein
VSTEPRPDRPVAAWPCQSICKWAATETRWTDPTLSDLLVFRCAGCGSEWVRSEVWTPIDAEGQVPPEVVAERQR